MGKIFIKPTKENSQIIDPATGEYLPADGVIAENSIYWQRRINDGDVCQSKPQPKTKGEKL